MWLTGLVAPRHVGSSQTRARTRVPCIGRQILNHCATREALNFFNRYRPIHIVSCCVSFGRLYFSRSWSISCRLSIVGIELFIGFPYYPFNVLGMCSDIPSFISVLYLFISVISVLFFFFSFPGYRLINFIDLKKKWLLVSLIFCVQFHMFLFQFLLFFLLFTLYLICSSFSCFLKCKL